MPLFTFIDLYKLISSFDIAKKDLLNSFAAKETIWIDDVRPIHEIDKHLDFIFKPINRRGEYYAFRA